MFNSIPDGFKSTLLLIGLVSALPASGATVIESIDDDGKTGKVTIDTDRARIDSGTLGGYILVNLDEALIYAINHKERAILDLRTPLLPSPTPHAQQTDKKVTPPSIAFKKVGKGPIISGYATSRYSVSVDGMHCFDEYVSEQLLSAPGVKRFTEVLGQATGANSDSGMGIPFDPDAPCESADDLADDFYPKFGIPMRTVGSNGITTHEITRVITDYKAPVGTFASPAGYRRMTRAELAARDVSKIPAQSQDSENLDNEDLNKLRQQIRQQIEIMKKRQSKPVAPQEPAVDSSSDISETADKPATP